MKNVQVDEKEQLGKNNGDNSFKEPPQKQCQMDSFSAVLFHDFINRFLL